MHKCNQDIDEFYSDKWRDYATQTIDEQVPTEQSGGAYGPVPDAAKRQGNKRDDDQRIENNRRQDRRLRRREAHDIEYVELRKRSGKHGGNNGEIFCYVIGQRKCGYRTEGNQHLFAYLDDFDKLRG